MSLCEKLFSLFAVVFAFILVFTLVFYPEYRQLKLLLPLSLFGLIVNILLMFIVFRDIFLRPFATPNQKYYWLLIILFFWPAILYYLPAYGFKKRNSTRP